MSEFAYLTVDQVLQLHEDALMEPGLSGIRSFHALASSVMQPQQNVFGQEQYPTLADKVAALGYFLIVSHPFIDGNKRTAALAIDVMLDANGYARIASDDEYENILVSVADGAVSRDMLANWLGQHMRVLEDPGNIVPIR